MAEGITPQGRYSQSDISDSPPGRDRRLVEQAMSQGIIIYTLPAFVTFIAVVLTLSFIILIVSVFAGLHLENSLLHSNPLAAYEGVWPGQSTASVAAYAQRTPQGYISCVSDTPGQQFRGMEVRIVPGPPPSSSKIRCMKVNAPDDGKFRWMMVTIDENRVQELQLSSDSFPQDVLLLYWGPPDSISRSGTDSLLNLYWDHSTYSAMAVIRETDSIVKSVILTARE